MDPKSALRKRFPILYQKAGRRRRISELMLFSNSSNEDWSIEKQKRHKATSRGISVTNLSRKWGMLASEELLDPSKWIASEASKPWKGIHDGLGSSKSTNRSRLGILDSCFKRKSRSDSLSLWYHSILNSREILNKSIKVDYNNQLHTLTLEGFEPAAVHKQGCARKLLFQTCRATGESEVGNSFSTAYDNK